jgi:hypothetical protein
MPSVNRSSAIILQLNSMKISATVLPVARWTDNYPINIDDA